MTVESPLAEQQRAIVELYLHSTWIKASIALEDDSLFIEYANHQREHSTSSDELYSHIRNLNQNCTPNAASTVYDSFDNITSQKRLVQITKPDNIGLGNN